MSIVSLTTVTNSENERPREESPQNKLPDVKVTQPILKISHQYLKLVINAEA